MGKLASADVAERSPDASHMQADGRTRLPRTSSAVDSAEFADATRADAEDTHMKWLRANISGAGNELPSNDQNRRQLFQLLSMLAVKERCEYVLDVAGLGGPLKANDTILFRGHTGRWIGIRSAEVVCNISERSSAVRFVLETKASALQHNSKVAFRMVGEVRGLPNSKQQWLGVTPTYEVRLLQHNDGARDTETQFIIQADCPGQILSGMAVYLKAVGVSRTIDVEGEAVRARTQDQGTLQRIILEKETPDGEVPAPCPQHELSLRERAWLLRCGVRHAMVDRQQLARFLAGHRPGCAELLKAYARLWEVEWRQAWTSVLHAEAAEDSAGSPASRQSSRGARSSDSGRSGGRPRSRQRRSRREWISGMFSGVLPEDRSNGKLFVSALRSFFATALRMSQLEADPVQRVIEAFADALVSDTSFLDCFSLSMLPERERRAYRTPDEVIFGLTYTTLMLNTDTHSKQVAQKMWDTKKFVAAGKDCGVTGGLMMQIFRSIRREEL
mmetsp:Transcript_117316/g.378620  ORF Transcript_117316/g.378620 Transcript_117316/m.378620 type:complete len:502 (+) Transcript_117316:1-1506(+)